MESTERTIKCKCINRYKSLLFIPLLLLPFLGIFLCFLGWWMFFSCLLCYTLQLVICGFLFEIDSDENIAIPVNQIASYVKKEKNWIILYRVFMTIVAILDLYPFFAMSETIMYGLFSTYGTYEGGILVTLLVLLITVLNLFFIYSVTDFYNLIPKYENFKKTGLTPTEESEKEKQIEAQKKEAQLKADTEKYGEGFIFIGSNPKLYINESLQKVFIHGNAYNFKDILSFSIQDNAETIYSGSTATAKTNTGSMLGRAAVGGLIAGNVGAVIGATTASKTINNSGSISSVLHNYTVAVTINDLKSPLITFRIGSDQDLLNRISSVLTIIVNRNK